MQSVLNIHRRIFKADPAERFAKKFNKSPDCWRETWRRYKQLEYTKDEAYEYLILITRMPIRKETFYRWLKRTEIYNKAQVAIKAGARTVQPNYFGKLTVFVTREITKNNKYDTK